MFIKPVIRNIRGTLESYIYYRLCESYRDEYGRSKWRSVLGLGRMEGLDRSQREGFILRLNEMLKGSPGLFIAADDPTVESYTQDIFNKLLDLGKVNIEEVVSGSRHCLLQEAEIRHKADIVKASSLRHKEVREVGSEHLCFETARKLKLDKFLLSHGFSVQEASLALTQIVSRAVHPASELGTARWIAERSAVCHLSGYDASGISKDKLYQSALKLFEQKEALEEHLSSWTRELFSFEDSIIIYDLTNTFFQGAMRGSKMARFGRSKEKRNDCKLLVLAMVINREGFPKHYSLFEGNLCDSASLERIIDSLDARMEGMERKPTVVMDAGIATEANLELLRKREYHYLCVSRRRLTEYRAEEGTSTVVLSDKKGNPIELLAVSPGTGHDRYLWVRSQMKAVKESQMKDQFCRRFEEELAKIKASISRKGGVKKPEKVNRRIGRAQQKYPSVQGWYDLTLETSNDTVCDLSWQRNPQKESDREAGVYFIRTSIPQVDEQLLWMIYNTIREVEYTFSVLKTDLDLRPIYHKTDKASMAHLHLGILAYWLVVTIRHQLKKKGISKSWRQIVEIMDSHKWVESTMLTPEGNEVSIGRCSEPAEAVKEVYTAVNISHQPLKPQKSVRYQIDIQKKCTADCQGDNSS